MATLVCGEAADLRDLAAWFDFAASWLASEVTASRAFGCLEKAGIEHRLERVTFHTEELNAMLVGFRRATDLMASNVSCSAGLPRGASPAIRNAPYLRVVK